jgi:dTDP-4-dehydrorhamnose 3,5-epimerase
VFERLRIPDVLRLTPRRFPDARGSFQETWVAGKWPTGTNDFVQDNLSVSRQSVLRGLHFQNPHSQGKLIFAVTGAIWDVAVDVRVGSPTFGQWVAEELSAENGVQLFIPRGFAHGFVVLSESAHVIYKCDDVYTPGAEVTLRWNDPELGIAWPVQDPILSPRDAGAPSLAELRSAGALPSFGDLR